MVVVLYLALCPGLPRLVYTSIQAPLGIVVNSIWRVGDHQVRFGWPQELLHIWARGTISAHQPVVAEFVDLASLSLGLLGYWRNFILVREQLVAGLAEQFLELVRCPELGEVYFSIQDLQNLRVPFERYFTGAIVSNG